MCVICLQYQKDRDIWDALQMVDKARKEPGSVPKDHLDDIEEELMFSEDPKLEERK